MKLWLKLNDTGKTLRHKFADTDTLRRVRRCINPKAPSSVHLSFNRKDELLAPSLDVTLLSLDVISGDIIYYSFDQSAFVASVQRGASSKWKLDDYETLAPQLKSNQAVVHDPMDVEISPAVSKRLSEPFFLKQILLEKSGDTGELTTLVLSVHAVMLESGFLLLDHGSDKFSFSNELLSVSLRYSLPVLITCKDTNTVEFVTVRFQNIGPHVVVYGTLGGCRERMNMTYLHKRRFVRVFDTLKLKKESSSIVYRKVFMFWRMVKDGLAIPLLIGLCDKAGLESPPCLMQLPTELKMKILESLPGVSIGKMACVCTEMRYLASDNDLWKQKYLEEANGHVMTLTRQVNWKFEFASFWRRRKRLIRARRILPERRSKSPFFCRRVRGLYL